MKYYYQFLRCSQCVGVVMRFMELVVLKAVNADMVKDVCNEHIYDKDPVVVAVGKRSTNSKINPRIYPSASLFTTAVHPCCANR